MMVENVHQIEAEQSIVWLDETARALPYVRESMMPLPFRSKAPRLMRRLVAYATIKPNAAHVRPGRFERRYWWLMSHDPYNNGGGPIEAVDPRSIAAGQLSKPMTEEQWNRNGSRERQF